MDKPKNIKDVKPIKINLISLDNKPIKGDINKDKLKVSNKFINFNKLNEKER